MTDDARSLLVLGGLLALVLLEPVGLTPRWLRGLIAPRVAGNRSSPDGRPRRLRPGATVR
jgi:hypothetical protein